MTAPAPAPAPHDRPGAHPLWVSCVRITCVGLVAAVLGACGGGSGGLPGAPSAAASVPADAAVAAGASAVASDAATAGPGVSVVATARAGRRSVPVRSAPGGAAVVTLPNPTPDGAPLTFRVLGTQAGALHVQLPVRPNGATGWIAADQVDLTLTHYRLVVHRHAHRLEVQHDGRPTATYPVGIGVSVTPTPAGTYYLTELLVTPDPAGVYGPYAFALSAFSPTLTSFAGGPGQIGLHGTDDPGHVGTDVSHGCLRVTNDVITRLARELPLGTPVEIGA